MALMLMWALTLKGRVGGGVQQAAAESNHILLVGQVEGELLLLLLQRGRQTPLPLPSSFPLRHSHLIFFIKGQKNNKFTTY